jgi:hypothetical protein
MRAINKKKNHWTILRIQIYGDERSNALPKRVTIKPPEN